MTWDPNSGGFTPGSSGQVALFGGDTSGSKSVTVQDLINLGLIDANGRSMAGRSLGGAILNPSDTRLAASVAAILQDSASSIELNSPTLFKKMNGAAGVVIGSAGIAGYNSAGTATFTLDPETGSVTLSGTVTATAGVIGGWTLGATSLTAGSGATTVGLDSGGTNPAFYAGSATPGSAPYRVTQAGVLTASGATISGTITATTGTIGGFEIGTNYIRNTGTQFFGLSSEDAGGSLLTRIWAGSTFTNRDTAPFRVNELGRIWCVDMNAAAKISAADQITSTLAIGTMPFVVTSTTRCTNLNVATAGTADVLTTARNIGGVSFNGSADIRPIETRDSGAAHYYAFDGGAASGAATATFPGNNKPGSNTSNSWLVLKIDAGTYYIPFWA